MVHPEFAHIGNIPDKAIEECSELILAICKANRFGWHNVNPDDPKKRENHIRVREEIEDVKLRITELETFLDELE